MLEKILRRLKGRQERYRARREMKDFLRERSVDMRWLRHGTRG